MKMRRLTWQHKQTDESDVIIADEDHMEIIVGQLMDQYWDPDNGWVIDYRIEDIK